MEEEEKIVQELVIALGQVRRGEEDAEKLVSEINSLLSQLGLGETANLYFEDGSYEEIHIGGYEFQMLTTRREHREHCPAVHWQDAECNCRAQNRQISPEEALGALLGILRGQAGVLQEKITARNNLARGLRSALNSVKRPG